MRTHTDPEHWPDPMSARVDKRNPEGQYQIPCREYLAQNDSVFDYGSLRESGNICFSRAAESAPAVFLDNASWFIRPFSCLSQAR